MNFTCNVNIPSKKGEFLLHIACTANSLEMIKILIESGASSKCNDQTKDGDSPLHIASRIGATDIVKYLVEACDCKPSMTLRNSEGRLPVDYACKHSLKMVEMVSQSYSVKDLTSREYDINNWSYRSDHIIIGEQHWILLTAVAHFILLCILSINEAVLFLH